MDRAWTELGLTWTELWVTIVTAMGVYGAMIFLSRVFGQRQFSTSTSYDLAFVFALGSLLGRTVLVRTSLAGAVVGLGTMFVLHAATGWLHHHLGWVHRLIQNDPILVVAHGRILEEGLAAAGMSTTELRQELRLEGVPRLEAVQAAILERNGRISVLRAGTPVGQGMVDEVVGGGRLSSPS
jgi:uncharacterized membrane protein YcaP (DUF421 family)